MDEIIKVLANKTKMQIEKKKVKCEIKFTDSLRFMATSLGNLTDNLSDSIGKKSCED